MTVVVVVVCLALVLAGLAAIVRWGGLAVEPPPGPWPSSDQQRPLGLVLRRYLWYVDLAAIAGIGAAVLMAGAGGRLAMRLLAVTAGDGAQGRITEAGEVVGEITAGGTIGFVLFLSLFTGFIGGAVFLLLRRWLPAGRLGGFIYGLLLLLVLGTRADPLRAANPDFDIVGPGWLAVAVLAAVVVLQGMLVAALAARVSRSLPLVAGRPGAAAAYLPLVALLPFVPVAALAVAGAFVAAGASRAAPVVAAWKDRRVDLAGRAVLAAVALVALPGFFVAVADILS